MKKLTRSRNKLFAGVIGGIAEYFDIDPSLARVIFVFVMVFTGLVPGVVFYIITMVVIPRRADDHGTRADGQNNNHHYSPNPEPVRPQQSSDVHDVPHRESTNSQ